MAYGSDITETLGNVGGRTTAHGYNSADSVRKQYTGYEKDDESGLDFAQARYYNSRHGRFTSADPLTASASIKNPQTFNRYSYVLNSPYKFTNPLGLVAQQANSRTDRNESYGGAWGAALGGMWETVQLEDSSPSAEAAEPPPTVIVQANGTTYTGTLNSSTFNNNDTGNVSVSLNYTWHTTQTHDDGTGTTRALVSQDVSNILNDGLSRMASNAINAHKALYNLPNIEKVSITLEGSIGLGITKKAIAAKEGSVGGSVTFEFSNPDALKAKVREANDTIQLQMSADLEQKSMITAWSNGKSVKVGDQQVSTGATLSSHFSQQARDEANAYAQKLYRKTFPSRYDVLREF